jgi:outer membrane protein
LTALVTSFPLLFSAAAFADEAADPAFPGVVAPAAVAPHWGLGLAASANREVYRGDSSQTTAIPLILYDSAWLHVFGNTLDLKLPPAGTLRFALRAKYALGDGYKPGDSAFLAGMSERKGSLLLGAAASWKTPLATVSAEWLKAGNNSHGQQAQLSAEHAFRYGRLELVPHLGASWSDSKYVDYYYGVTQAEATAARPAYTAGAATDVSAGLRVTYALRRNQLLLLDAGDTHHGKGVTDSPLTDKRNTPSLKVGYLYLFQ